jgi:oxygen-independent coproporphyrinogen-3 oxidase
MEYLSALEAELALRGDELKSLGASVGTVYIGGGTPTALPVAELERLLVACRNRLPLANAEWTVEANPGTIDTCKAQKLAAYGVNRISLGVQDTFDHRLALLGRVHTTVQAKQAFFLCRDVFASVSVDLMTGLPGQTPQESLVALEDVLSWQPDHVSLYGLKVEDETPLAALVDAGQLILPTEDDALAMLLQGRETLMNAGYNHYEIANFAKPGHLCRHNLTYWKNRPYLGLGLGAHSYWQGARLQNIADLNQYKAELSAGRLPVGESLPVSERQAQEDMMMLGLRLMEGVAFADFLHRFGLDARDVFAREISRLEKQGLVSCDKKRLWLTTVGYPLANLVFAEFISV